MDKESAGYQDLHWVEKLLKNGERLFCLVDTIDLVDFESNVIESLRDATNDESQGKGRVHSPPIASSGPICYFRIMAEDVQEKSFGSSSVRQTGFNEVGLSEERSELRSGVDQIGHNFCELSFYLSNVLGLVRLGKDEADGVVADGQIAWQVSRRNGWIEEVLNFDEGKKRLFASHVDDLAISLRGD